VGVELGGVGVGGCEWGESVRGERDEGSDGGAKASVGGEGGLGLGLGLRGMRGLGVVGGE